MAVFKCLKCKGSEEEQPCWLEFAGDYDNHPMHCPFDIQRPPNWIYVAKKTEKSNEN